MPYADTRRTYDYTTGNLFTETKPRQVADQTGVVTSYGYAGNRVFPRTVTNEVGHRAIAIRDAGTGALVRQLGPNAKTTSTCDPDEPTFVGKCAEERSDIDGFGRALRHYRSFDRGADDYEMHVVDTFQYSDAQGEVTERHAQGDPSSPTWTTTVGKVDGIGRIVEERQLRSLVGVADATRSYTYDAAGQLGAVQVPDPTRDGNDPARSNTTRQVCFQVIYSYVRDSLGRPTSIVRPDGTRTNVSYGEVELYSQVWAQSREVTEAASDGSEVHTSGIYDPYGRLIQVLEFSNRPRDDQAVTAYGYDDHDRLIEVDDAETSTRLTADWLGNRVKIDREGRTWFYQYDADGNMVAETTPVPTNGDAGEYTTLTTFDAIGRPLVHRPARRGRSDAELDALAIGNTVHGYDRGPNGMGRLTSVSQPRSNASLTHFLDVNYAYDANGSGTFESRSINPKSAVGATEGPLLTQFVKRSYDASGKLTSSTWDDGQLWSRSYDERGLLQKVEYAASLAGPRQTIADYGSRSTAGMPRSRGTGAGFGAQERVWTYDVLGRPSVDTIRAGANVRARRSYAFWQTGDLKSVTGGNWSHTGALLADAGAQYTYDGNHRLASASGTSGYAANLTYSRTGNIFTAKVAGPASVVPREVSYEYDETAIEPDVLKRDPQAVNELRDVTGQPFATFKYDEAGNMVERALPRDMPMSLAWDGDDHLVRVGGPGATAIETYHYDQAYQRVWAVSGNIVRFWFGESETDMPLSGGVATRYMELADESGALGRSERVGSSTPVVELHYSDALHNLMMAMGPSAQVEASFVYGAFGEVVREFGGGDHRRQFNDKENDVASGLRYYGYRSYDPVALRWTSGDPLFRFAPEINLGSVQQHNLYQFSANNPLRYYDPDGRVGMDNGTDSPCLSMGECRQSAEAEYPDSKDAPYTPFEKSVFAVTGGLLALPLIWGAFEVAGATGLGVGAAGAPIIEEAVEGEGEAVEATVAEGVEAGASEAEAAAAEASTPAEQVHGPFTHQINQGGLDEITESQQMLATPDRTSGWDAVRATAHPLVSRIGGPETIEFFTTAAPDGPPHPTNAWVQWSTEPGGFINIILTRIAQSDGSITVLRPPPGH